MGLESGFRPISTSQRAYPRNKIALLKVLSPKGRTMFIFFLWLLACSNLAIANELMTLLNEGARIESEAPYGYSFNSLSYREGHLIRTPTQGHYEYFNDPLNTDAERLKIGVERT